MNDALLEMLLCPRCRQGSLQAARRDGDEGELRCAACDAVYPVVRGIPRLLKQPLQGAELQSQQSFSAKWARQRDYGAKGSPTERFQREWYLRRYGWKSEDELRSFLSTKSRILDAGTGLGRDSLWYHELSGRPVVALDISTAVDTVREKFRAYPDIHPVQGDILELPLQDESFDFVACDQVLSNIADPRQGLARLVSACRRGGHIIYYVYKKKGPIREFCDDHVRARVTQMSPEEAWEWSARLTRFAHALSDLKVTVEVPEDLAVLDLPAGRYDLQRFIYYQVFKAFWNDEFTFDENVLVNYDWYHPAFTFRFAPEEARSWAGELGLEIVRMDLEDASAISVLARRI